MKKITNLHLESITVYPVKSLGGISLTESKAAEKGLEFDRLYMLVDKNGHFLTQRTRPHMALFETGFEAGSIRINFKEKSIELPLSLKNRERLNVQIWNDELNAMIAPDEFNTWFSEQLNEDCRLVYMDQKSTRKIDPDFAINEETVSFADGFPYLMISEASLEELNRKLEIPVPMNRFRPNLTLKGGYSFIEDDIDTFSIGEVQFKVVKSCARCMVTTIDQKTGQIGKEPLKTLSTFRKQGNKVLFGQNLICLKEGKIRIGDEIKIDSLKSTEFE